MIVSTDNYDIYKPKPGTVFTSAQISEDGKTVKLFWKYKEGRLDIDLNSPKFEKLFPIIFVEKLSLDSKVMRYSTKTLKQRTFKQLLESAIKQDFPNFRIALYSPSLEGEDCNINFIPGEFPAVGKTANFWFERFKSAIPEKNSRMMSVTEYVLFIGYVMNYLIEEEKMSSKLVWSFFCDDSSQIENYSDSKDLIYDLEPTGSRKIGAFFDLANTSKIVCADNILSKFASFSKFMLVSGSYNESGKAYPICSIGKLNSPDSELNYSVGLFACDV